MVTTESVTQPVVSSRSWWGAGLALAAIGWGANQFAPLIVLYQARLGLSAAVLEAMFGLYALGLVPALLIGGRLSDRFGRRPVVLPALALSFAGSCLLMAGGDQPNLLYVGRFLAGVASGLAFGTGAAWLKELSAGAGDAAVGPRRATVTMTSGFAAGPLIAGALAQWAPAPTVTVYLPHLVLVAVGVAVVRRTPDSGRRAAVPTVPDESPRRPLRRHFLLVILPFAPWVFGTAAVGVAYLPALAARNVGDKALLYCAVAVALGGAVGIASQPLAKAVHRPGTNRLLLTAMGFVVLSLAFAALAAQVLSPTLALAAVAVLGIAYGVSQFCGLLEVQQLADTRSLGIATAAYQALSYLGFAFPFLMSLAQAHLGASPGTLLLILAAIAAVATVWLAVATGSRRRRLPARPTERSAAR
ncbi:MFS transporter [Solihabitans fulvus]|uniref:MFS transporter n=1 Tax=Solihabitans fulvus TaxID=1892852 RepID=A0A5B2W4C6_9PSEU|nr:MFS transporter [Solihabitans fulvus]KAA2245984.1 MFS transporter [Solihabitans fulvus]